MAASPSSSIHRSTPLLGMSIHSLPPELLLEIFSLTIPDSPSTNRGLYDRRQATLCSMALVHPRWTRAAQKLLWKEVWIQVSTQDSQTRKLGQLAQAGGAYSAKNLRLSGPLEILLSLRDTEEFKRITTIQHTSVRGQFREKISEYAQFRRKLFYQLSLPTTVAYHPYPC